MIALSESSLVLKLSAPIAWRGEHKVAQKLHGFAATELGSALDMRRAAELAPDAECRRLFFRHAMDEHRHATRFAELARRIDPTASVRARERAHAEPADLYRRLGHVRFLAFVHLSETQAERQFHAVAAHFARARSPFAPTLSVFFAELAREEHVHVAYSRYLLAQCFPEASRARKVERALSRERRALAWSAWKRAGFRLGDGAIALLMAVLFIGVLPLFALVSRLHKPEPGWVAAHGAGDGKRGA